MHTNKMITVKTWLDSGANCESRYQVVFEVDKYEWLDMNEHEQEEYAKDYAWNRMEWGYEVVEEAQEEPTYHLRGYGDITKEQLDCYIKTGSINKT